MNSNIHFGSYLLRMKNDLDKSCKANCNTHFTFSNNFFLNRTVHEITWKNTVQRVRLHMTIRRIHIACWITKATNTHSQYVILIAFPQQQKFHKRCSSFVIFTLRVSSYLTQLLYSIACTSIRKLVTLSQSVLFSLYDADSKHHYFPKALNDLRLSRIIDVPTVRQEVNF
jgi:hypothetical protein